MKNSFFEHYADLISYSDRRSVVSGLGEMAYCILRRSFHTTPGNGPGVGQITCQTIFVPFQVTMKMYSLLSGYIPCTPSRLLCYGVVQEFTLHGTDNGTGIGNGTGTIGDNGSSPIPGFGAVWIVLHGNPLFPGPLPLLVPVPVPCNVNVPLLCAVPGPIPMSIWKLWRSIVLVSGHVNQPLYVWIPQQLNSFFQLKLNLINAGATKRCSECKQHYCSRECQRRDWQERNHKARCLKKERYMYILSRKGMIKTVLHFFK